MHISNLLGIRSRGSANGALLPLISRRGFTFIEVMIVVLIVGIVLGSSWPLFGRSLDAWQLKTYSKELSQILTYWRQRALVDEKTYVMRFELDQNKITVQEQDQEKILKTYAIPSGLFLECDREDVGFYPDSSMDVISIYVSAKAGRKYFLTSKGFWGGIKVEAL